MGRNGWVLSQRTLNWSQPFLMRERMALPETEITRWCQWRQEPRFMRIMLGFRCHSGTEHAHWRASRQLLNLSEQQLVDCDTRSHGCNGGFHTSAWEYLKSHPQMLT